MHLPAICLCKMRLCEDLKLLEKLQHVFQKVQEPNILRSLGQ